MVNRESWPLLRGSSGNTWSFALGWISQQSAFGLVLEGRSTWVILSNQAYLGMFMLFHL